MKPTFSNEDCFDYLVADSVDIDRVRAAAESGKQLTVKLGIDPTSTNIHLGRAVPVWRLRAFQEMGHKICIVVGDFTAQVGDTSDKDAERPMLSAESVRQNMESYERQLWLILNPEKKDLVSFHWNSEWLGKLTFTEVSQLADAFSVNQFVKRDLISQRLEKGGRVSLREMLYPLMQGYDSVVLKSDIEIGGLDQWFNLLAGRTLQERMGQVPQAVLVNQIVAGTDGTKMSSSKGNVISLNQEPFSLFTQMMQISDADMRPYLAFYPRTGRPFTPEELDSRLEAGENPRNLKLEMAERMVSLIFGDEAAQECRSRWDREATEQQLPEEIPDFVLTQDVYRLIELVVATGLALSNSEARRLIEQRGVRLEGNVVEDVFAELSRGDLAGKLLQVGKHKFIRLVS